MPGTLAQRVRRARETAGLTQVEAAIAAGVSLTALRNIEQGVTTDPRVSTVERIFAALEGHHDPDATRPRNGHGRISAEVPANRTPAAAQCSGKEIRAATGAHTGG